MANAFLFRRVIRCRGFALMSARQGLSGIEGLGGIPGTVGGALWMNAGAYGHEIGTVTETVRVAREGKVVEIPGSRHPVELSSHVIQGRRVTTGRHACV